MTDRVLLSLDLSYKVGWACSTGKSGVKDLLKFNGDFGQMGHEFSEWLDRKICMEHVTHVIIERGFFRGKSSYPLSGLVYTAHVVSYGLACVRHELTPRELKVWATGKGNASKADMMAEAARRGLEFVSDDEADALLLLAYLQEIIK